MTTVEILFRYAAQPSETVTRALAATRSVYGIRRLTFDRASHLLRVEYDATRLSAAAVSRLLHQAGLHIVKEMPLVAPDPAPAAAA